MWCKLEANSFFWLGQKTIFLGKILVLRNVVVLLSTNCSKIEKKFFNELKFTSVARGMNTGKGGKGDFPPWC